MASSKTKAATKAKPKPAAKKPAKARKASPLTPDDPLELIDSEFEFALLNGCELTFPITDGRKLSKYQEKLQRIARNKKIDELARAGATIRDISVRMAELGWKGVGRVNVCNILAANLDIVAKDAALTTIQRKQLELNKLDQAEMAHFHRFLRETNPDAAEKLSRVVERIWKRRDMLEGRTQKVEVTGQDGGPVELSTVTRVIFPTVTATTAVGSGGEEEEEENA